MKLIKVKSYNFKGFEYLCRPQTLKDGRQFTKQDCKMFYTGLRTSRKNMEKNEEYFILLERKGGYQIFNIYLIIIV